MKLRYYQEQAVNAIYKFLATKPNKNPCIVLPTAAGKSLVIARIVSDAVQRWSGRVLILAHVKELLEQNAEKIKLLAPEIKIGVYSAGLKRRDTSDNVIVAGIQSIFKRPEEFGKFDLILVDEAHLITTESDGMYKQLLIKEKEINPNVRLIGLTATPYRMHGGLICKPDNLLNEVCYEVGIKELILRGYLTPLVSRGGCSKPDFEGLHIRAGEFLKEEVEQRVNKEQLVAEACKEIVLKTMDRNKVLIFAVSIEHAKAVKAKIELYSSQSCGLITGDTSSEERAEIISKFRNAGLKFLVNVGVLTTGFDAPAIDCVAILRPTCSPGLYYQMVGRGFRLSPGKKNCLILDYGGNIVRHGPVDCIAISEHTDNGIQKPPPMSECPKCHAIYLASLLRCPDCGYTRPRMPENWSHKKHSSKANILSNGAKSSDNWYKVARVEYHLHRRGNDPNAIPTMRVDYYNVVNLKIVSEWICPQHTGYARTKALKWWAQRCNIPLPTKTEEVVKIAMAGILATPKKIKLKKDKSDYQRIAKYEDFSEILNIVEKKKEEGYEENERVDLYELAERSAIQRENTPLPDSIDGVSRYDIQQQLKKNGIPF